MDKKHFKILESVGLFKGINKSDLQSLLACLSAKTMHYNKNGIVFLRGEKIESFGIVLSGQVQIVHED